MTKLIGQLEGSKHICCPGCGADMMGGYVPADLERKPPGAGDVAVCWWCAAVLQYLGEPLSLRPLPPGHQGHEDPVVQQIQREVRGRPPKLRRVV